MAAGQRAARAGRLALALHRQLDRSLHRDGVSASAWKLSLTVRRQDVERFARRLERGQGALPQLVEDETYARRVLGNLDRAVADLADVAAKLDRGQGTLGKLVNDPSLYHEARGLVGRVRESWWLRLMGGGHASDSPSTSPTDAPEPAGKEPIQ